MEEQRAEAMTGPSPVRERAGAAKAAARKLAAVPAETKDRALLAAASRIESDAAAILAANAADMAEAARLAEKGEMAGSLLDRLSLDAGKVRAMAHGVRAVAALPDPSGRLLSRTLLDDGLVLEKVTCPLGVIAVIFESRPDAVPQIAALALKSGNAALLKGGRESARSVSALLSAFHGALAGFPEIPADALQLLSSREKTDALLSLDRDVDLVIPRGGAHLVRHVRSHTRIPVLGTRKGFVTYTWTGPTIRTRRSPSSWTRRRPTRRPAMPSRPSCCIGRSRRRCSGPLWPLSDRA